MNSTCHQFSRQFLEPHFAFCVIVGEEREAVAGEGDGGDLMFLLNVARGSSCPLFPERRLLEL